MSLFQDTHTHAFLVSFLWGWINIDWEGLSGPHIIWYWEGAALGFFIVTQIPHWHAHRHWHGWVGMAGHRHYRFSLFFIMLRESLHYYCHALSGALFLSFHVSHRVGFSSFHYRDAIAIFISSYCIRYSLAFLQFGRRWCLFTGAFFTPPLTSPPLICRHATACHCLLPQDASFSFSSYFQIILSLFSFTHLIIIIACCFFRGFTSH